MRNQIVLDDGRMLGFAEYGDPHGRPMMYFHGWPRSRLEAGLVGAAGLEHHIRIIAPDRPGFGRSDFKRGRKIADWPDDVVVLADALELDRFGIMGQSGGGPYVAICALKIPHRLRAVGIISGMGRYLAAAIPNCYARFYENEGHVSLFVNHMDEILLALMS